MPTSVWSPEVRAAIDQARTPASTRVRLGDRTVELPRPFPSPGDWRDQPIYQIVIDRFDNPAGPPRFPWHEARSEFQGGTFEGVRRRLDYLRDLGIGAIWLSPVLKNCPWDQFVHHGYAIQDFLEIEPRFASAPDRAEAELQALIDDAHARDIYVIFDVVLNHAGDVFAYAGHGATAPWRDHPYIVNWRDENGRGREDWTEPPTDPSRHATVWPAELRRNELFRRQGAGGEGGGDFYSLKELVTGYQEATPERGPDFPVRSALIRAAQYLIARFDVDGFRIDTLKFVERDFAQVFGAAVREFALSIGKTNFFTFGEVYDDEEKIAHFIGRNAMEPGDLVGVDAALDFPLFDTLSGAAKGLRAPAEVARTFAHRQEIQRDVVSSHGEAGRYFVTFLDNHDQHHRFYHRDSADPHRFDHQLTLAVGCLFSLQGIPCLYYGTEQGLHGAGDKPEAVREALWGKPRAFDPAHPFYASIRELAAVRRRQPALRYGRQYHRPISGDGAHFGISPFPEGVLAFSRILQDLEVLVVANTHTRQPWAGDVLVDFSLNRPGSTFAVVFTNRADGQATPPGSVVEKAWGSVEIRHLDGGVTAGPIRVLPVRLRPMEIQVLARAS